MLKKFSGGFDWRFAIYNKFLKSLIPVQRAVYSIRIIRSDTGLNLSMIFAEGQFSLGNPFRWLIPRMSTFKKIKRHWPLWLKWNKAPIEGSHLYGNLMLTQENHSVSINYISQFTFGMKIKMRKTVITNLFSFIFFKLSTIIYKCKSTHLTIVSILTWYVRYIGHIKSYM